MYSIAPRLTDNYSTNESLNALIDAIDRKIVELAVIEYNNTRFGTSHKVDYHQYKDLCTYRRMLLNKLLGCNCLQDQFLVKIVSKLKRLIKKN